VAFRPFKLTWFFWWSNGAGWSESYYLLAGSRRDVVQQAADLLDFRLAMLISSTGVEIAYQRIAEVTPPFRVKLTRLHVVGFWFFPQVEVGPWDGWNVRYASFAGGFRPSVIRGAPRPPAVVIDPKAEARGWLESWEQWLAALIRAGGAIQVADRQQRYPVTALTVDAAHNYQILATVPDHGWPVGTTQLASFAGLRSRPTITWQHLVDVVSANQLSIRGTNFGRISYPGGGWMTKVSYRYHPISGGQIIKYGLRKVHRPFAWEAGQRLIRWPA